ncbi:hypothetical protein NA57DRAFT_53680 [Rhizodiscina lignyota]|uniref:DUF7730 domain-containing protein n=1 Tax=Rhizodiscina lignyota TaxID=1504668 RepID=A0A9P4IM29_9PEZI|nr:hypothetical protein NA57DRAFT_53680 [Rhizodiscina lignyota]
MVSLPKLRRVIGGPLPIRSESKKNKKCAGIAFRVNNRLCTLFRLPLELRQLIWRGVVGNRIIKIDCDPEISFLQGYDMHQPKCILRIAYNRSLLGSSSCSHKYFFGMCEALHPYVHYGLLCERLRKLPALFFVCKRIFIEAEEVLYRTNTFSFTGPLALERFGSYLQRSELGTMPRNRLSRIREIHITASLNTNWASRWWSFRHFTCGYAFRNLKSVHVTFWTNFFRDSSRKAIGELILETELLGAFPMKFKEVTCTIYDYERRSNIVTLLEVAQWARKVLKKEEENIRV